MIQEFTLFPDAFFNGPILVNQLSFSFKIVDLKQAIVADAI